MPTQNSPTMHIFINGQTSEWETLWGPRADVAYARETVRYLRRDGIAGDTWTLRPPEGDDARWSLFPEVPGLIQSKDGSLDWQFTRTGTYAVLRDDTVYGWLFLDAPGAYCRPAHAVDARDFGIRPDGTSCVTTAVNDALVQLSAQGGGVLAFGPGVYPTGTIRMQTNTFLHLDAGAVLQAVLDLAAHPLDDPDLAARDLPPSLIPGTGRRLIYFDHVENSGILGRGTVCGNGSELRHRYRSPRAMMQLVRAVGCRKIRFEGVFLRDSEFWNTHLILCDDVHFNGVKVLNEIPPPEWDAAWRPGSKSFWNNADGINPDSSTRITIEDGFFHTGDDCVPIKNTGCYRNQLADVSGVTVRRCLMRTPVTAMKMGTETRGGRMEQVTFEDIDVVEASRVIGVDLKDGVEGHQVCFRNIRVRRCNRPFDFWVLEREGQRHQTCFSKLQQVRVERLVIDRMGIEGCNQTSHIMGRDEVHDVRDVVLQGLRVEGRPIRDIADMDLEVNAFGRDITVME